MIGFDIKINHLKKR